MLRRNDQRALRRGQQIKGFLGLRADAARLVDRQRLIRVRVEFDLGHLNVDRRSMSTGPGRPERIR